MSTTELGVDAALILDTSHEAFVAMDVDGRIVAWNRAAEELFGWPRDEVLGTELAGVIVPEHLREAHRRGLAKYLETGEGPVLESRLELPALHRDGHEFEVEITISAVTAGSGRFFHAFLHDVSERVQRDRIRSAQLRVSERLATASSEDDLRLALEAVCRAGGWTFATIWNAGDDAEILHSPISWWHPGRDVSLFESAGRSAGFYRGRGLPGIVWKTGEPVWHWPRLESEGFPRRRAAERVGIRSGFAVPLVAGSEIVAILEMFGEHDEEPAEEQRALVAAAAPLIGEHIARRRAERNAAEQKDAFVATVSHELRTPLTAIVASAQTSIEYDTQLTPERKQELLSLILRQARRLMRLVDDLLRMSALQSRAILPQLERVDLVEAVRETLDELDIADRVRLEAPGDRTPCARADRDLCKQVAVNLLQNAIRYGEEPYVVHVEDDGLGEHVCMSVTDRGPGVDPSFVPRLFEKFQRAAHRSDQPGTGLGLSIVQEIVEAMEGRIRHEHVTPSGARFVVELPRA